MAKALVGHLRIDQRIPNRSALENQRLRRRVCDLEALVLRLQADNERLLLEQERGGCEHAPVVLEPAMLPA